MLTKRFLWVDQTKDFCSVLIHFSNDNKTVLYNPLFPSWRVQVYTYIYIYGDINHRKILCLVWPREGVVIRLFY